MSAPERVILRRLGVAAYEPTWEAMRRFTDLRTLDTEDEIWLVEHPPVFTLGQAGRPEHLLDPSGIPVVASDRGGQVTYHGLGQTVAYVLVDLRRAGFGVRILVDRLEQAVIDLLGARDVIAQRLKGAPGVYVGGRKVAALGLRVRGGCTYHGLALNVNLDLSPFERINPCGYPGLEVTSTHELGIVDGSSVLATELARRIANGLGLPALHEESQGSEAAPVPGP